MRVRRHHAWGAILIALFALPVLQPEGLPALERPVASFFAWFGRVPALNPRLWGTDAVGEEGEASPRARALEIENALLREQFAERLQAEDDLRGARQALEEAGLDRLPRAVVARVLRAHDPSAFRQSILIDRGEVDGVRPGLAVALGPVYVGRIEVVHPRSALVKLVTDRQSRLEVAFRTEKNVRLTGYLHGEGRLARGDTLPLRHVVAADGVGRVLAGTPVLTSNLDALVPAGLLVGRVRDVRDQDLDGMPLLTVEPALDLGRATRVLVLLPAEAVPPRR